jgi:hypothetical protein
MASFFGVFIIGLVPGPRRLKRILLISSVAEALGLVSRRSA